MPLIDAHGRLWGRVNLIDAGIIVVVLGLIMMVYDAMQLFRLPEPRIISVMPSTIYAQTPTQVSLTGEDFRQYLRARVGASEVPFFLETPTCGELHVPALMPGVYDVALYDETQELVVRVQAITVSAAHGLRRPALSGCASGHR